MKVTTLLSVIMSSLSMLVPNAFAQRAGHQPDALTTFTNALEHDGFDVNTGVVVPYNLPALWCDNHTSEWERYVCQ